MDKLIQDEKMDKRIQDEKMDKCLKEIQDEEMKLNNSIIECLWTIKECEEKIRALTVEKDALLAVINDHKDSL